jgi:cell division protein FtsI (penicillin-binding protein 3)
MIFPKELTPPKLPNISRGNILDRNGRILAFEKEVHSLYGWVSELKDIEESSILLEPILGVNKSRIYEYLNQKRDVNYFYIHRQLTSDAKDAISELISLGKLTGIRLEKELGRSYPEGELTAHLTGYVGYDNIGLDGLEYTLNSILSPGVIKQSLNKEYGHNVELTIDMNLQYMTAIAAKESYEENFADSVSVISMDAKNGHILSYVSFPTYNPNNFTQYTESEKINRITQTSYEPGSVFKIFSLSSFLDNKGVSVNDHFFCDGIYFDPLTNTTINCLGNHGHITTSGIIINSCNVATGKASETISNEQLYKTLTDFGFGKKTGIAFNGESNGLLRTPRLWSNRSKPTVSMGQEVSVSPIQVITAATALANNGILLKPHIVKKIVSQDGIIIREYGREQIRQVISPETSVTILDMMKEATESGTGIRTKIDGFNISTKTGTAQITDPETGKYDDSKFLASAIAIFPTEEPRIILYVIIENPKGNLIWGSRLAIPVIRKLVTEFTTYLDIETGSSPIYGVPTNIKNINNSIVDGIIFNNIAPDLSGLSKKDVFAVLAREGYKFNSVGSGYVSKQSPSPGSEINQDTIFLLEFE